ncbi:D-cysteine desulfhydrase family protein [Nocardioides massiliensis]|uniref:D-cysteine desulfhydrase n=1 Tax=Nocardioides massiliensis TaxID=1325935 RepID=A0ABT9NLV1_9ACTN|nr:D-cysteine desulfhydrase family protein [Nocardioides massiliensis]MDP9821373.1 D-cysteine desulfhydrase [Nocardioides massiliensis]
MATADPSYVDPPRDQPPQVEAGRPLVLTPTPLEPAPRLSQALGLSPDQVWLKRDDLAGLGGGGNKLRKLEVSLAEARKVGADILVTTGAAQSNHARLTAAVAARAGLNAVLVLAGDEPADRRGNLLLDELLGAHVVWAGELEGSDLGAGLSARADEVVAELRQSGRTPYLVPYGGTSPTTAEGYVAAARELEEQLPDLSHVVVAVGSGGTMAGLVRQLGPTKVLGVDTGAVADPRATVAGLLAEMGRGLEPASLRLDHDHVGEGYGALVPTVREAVELVARTEGVLLDVTYVGRAAAGLVAGVRSGLIRPGAKTVLMHTGGLPGLFGHPALG